jgi:hypothetical protein
LRKLTTRNLSFKEKSLMNLRGGTGCHCECRLSPIADVQIAENRVNQGAAFGHI